MSESTPAASSAPSLRWRGLRAQIVLWTVLPLTLVLIGVAFTGVYSHERAMRALVEERDRALAAPSAAQIRELWRERASELQRFATSEMLGTREPGAASEVPQLPDDVVVLDAAGRLIRPEKEAPAWAEDGAHTSALTTAVSARQEANVVPVVGSGASQVEWLLGVPILAADGAVAGVLAQVVRLPDLNLQAILDPVRVGDRGVVYLIDAACRILAHSESPHARNSLTGHSGISVALEAPGPGSTLCLAPDGERMTLAYAPVQFANLDWYVLIEQPWQDVVGPVLRYSQFMPLVAALAAVVSLLTLYYGVRSIVRPLQTLGRQAEQVAWGDFSATSQPVGGVKEIEDLRRTLDQMAQRIQGYQNGMHDYIAAITQGQEEERKRLARELHDETVQALIALGQRVEMAQKALSANPERAAERIGQVRRMVAEILEGVRRLNRDLRPVYLEDLGFIPALEMLARPENLPGLDVEFSIVGSVRRLPPDLELAAYRIVQEALHNVVQHAQATHVAVEVRFEAEDLILSVRDDGQGFEVPSLPDALARRGHFGLMGMQERAMLYGGRLTIRSEPGGGTDIVVRLPYPLAGLEGEEQPLRPWCPEPLTG
jgi:signal transduction histidine kinase